MPVALRSTLDRPTGVLFRTAAILGALGFLAVVLGVVSPEVHACLHADSGHADHVCAVTLAAQGFCDTASSAPLVAAVDPSTADALAGSASFAWHAPDHWHARAQAPPLRNA